jgi:hypothetical protein
VSTARTCAHEINLIPVLDDVGTGITIESGGGGGDDDGLGDEDDDDDNVIDNAVVLQFLANLKRPTTAAPTAPKAAAAATLSTNTSATEYSDVFGRDNNSNNNNNEYGVIPAEAKNGYDAVRPRSPGAPGRTNNNIYDKVGPPPRASVQYDQVIPAAGSPASGYTDITKHGIVQKPKNQYIQANEKLE